jgi:thioredoxin-related protein
MVSWERVMRKFLSLGLAAVLSLASLCGTLAGVQAARGLDPVAAGKATQEIVVFEVQNCAYCGMFRDHVLPGYRKTPRADELPVRFVDLTVADIDHMNLQGPIQIAPTIVLMKDGAEVGRIVGYTGPEIFNQLVSRMLGAAP